MYLPAILLIFVVTGVAFLLVRNEGVHCCGFGPREQEHAPEQPDIDMERDPVCGMLVSVTPETPVAEHQGRIYRFCSHECRRRFLADPAAFAAVEPGTPTCPSGRCSHGCCG